MMVKRNPLAPVGAMLAAGLVLSGCGNDKQPANILTVGKQMVGAIGGKRKTTKQDPRLVLLDINNALSTGSDPLALVTLRKSGGSLVLRQIASNGPYRTWSPWGSTERRSITTRNGAITATRGLGYDLMSAEMTESLEYLSNRREGQTFMALRWLDGENQTRQDVAECDVKRGKDEHMKIGGIDATVTNMTEVCATLSGKFTNHYKVARDGRILFSDQWTGPVHGHVVMQRLR